MKSQEAIADKNVFFKEKLLAFFTFNSTWPFYMLIVC
jgi:hypothetical protein